MKILSKQHLKFEITNKSCFLVTNKIHKKNKQNERTMLIFYTVIHLYLIIAFLNNKSKQFNIHSSFNIFAIFFIFLALIFII